LAKKIFSKLPNCLVITPKWVLQLRSQKWRAIALYLLILILMSPKLIIDLNKFLLILIWFKSHMINFLVKLIVLLSKNLIFIFKETDLICFLLIFSLGFVKFPFKETDLICLLLIFSLGFVKFPFEETDLICFLLIFSLGFVKFPFKETDLICLFLILKSMFIYYCLKKMDLIGFLLIFEFMTMNLLFIPVDSLGSSVWEMAHKISE
jgi:hypothetical protein